MLSKKFIQEQALRFGCAEEPFGSIDEGWLGLRLEVRWSTGWLRVRRPEEFESIDGRDVGFAAGSVVVMDVWFAVWRD